MGERLEESILSGSGFGAIRILLIDIVVASTILISIQSFLPNLLEADLSSSDTIQIFKVPRQLDGSVGKLTLLAFMAGRVIDLIQIAHAATYGDFLLMSLQGELHYVLNTFRNL